MIFIWGSDGKHNSDSSGICGQRRRRAAQSDQGFHCPLLESLDATECMNEHNPSDNIRFNITDYQSYRMILGKVYFNTNHKRICCIYCMQENSLIHSQT